MNKSGNCRHCGSPLYEGMKFCGNCGKPVEQMQQTDSAQRMQRPAGQTDNVRQKQRPAEQTDNARQKQRPAEQAQRTGSMQQRTSRPSAENAAYDPNTYENRVRRQRSSTNEIQNGQQTRPPYNTQNGQQARPSYNTQNGQQARPPYSEQAVRQNQQAAQNRQRYRQEELESDWQQSWDRAGEEDDGRFTPVQYVLMGIAVILLMALVAFGVYWILGRSTGNTGRRQEQNQISTETIQSDDMQAESLADIMILDDTQDKETEAQTTKVSESDQTETTQTETETESETEEAQTEKQTETQREDTVLSYPEFHVTIPGSWWGKYGIEQSNGSYTFYQQAARENGYGGVLFIISRYTDTSYKTLPNYEVIGTGGGAALVWRLSNDLQYPKENTAVAAEYQAMANDVAGIRAGIQVLISGEGPSETEAVPEIEILSEDYYVIEEPSDDTVQDELIVEEEPDYSGGYIPESSQRTLSDADVAGMSYDDLQMAINEIYARHGRIFQSESISSYFNSQSWYNGTVTAENFDESVFSSVESQNIQFLLEKMGN